MKMNIYKVKKWAAYMLCGFLPVIIFFITIMMFNFIYAVLFAILSIVVSGFIANMLLRHPFTELVEGSGLLTLTWDSTGKIDPFIVDVDPPFVRGNLGKDREGNEKKVSSIFDRSIVNYLARPKKGQLITVEMQNENGEIEEERKALLMPKEREKDDYLFKLGSFPTFIFNKQIGNFLPKSALSDFENNTFIQHMVLYLLKKTEELTRWVRDFGRHTVDMTKPKKPFLRADNKLLWIIIIAALVLMGMLFLPAIMDAMSGISGSIGGTGGGPITPSP